MKIAYFSYYTGHDFARKCDVDYKPNSSVLKAQSVARALLLAGHDVTIYSPGSYSGNRVVPFFTENIKFPEGILKVKYPKLYSYPKCT